MSDIEKKVNELRTKDNQMEGSRQFDSDTVENINKNQNEVDTMTEKLKKKAEKRPKESDQTAKIVDKRSMRR